MKMERLGTAEAAELKDLMRNMIKLNAVIATGSLGVGPSQLPVITIDVGLKQRLFAYISAFSASESGL